MFSSYRCVVIVWRDVTLRYVSTSLQYLHDIEECLDGLCVIGELLHQMGFHLRFTREDSVLPFFLSLAYVDLACGTPTGPQRFDRRRCATYCSRGPDQCSEALKKERAGNRNTVHSYLSLYQGVNQHPFLLLPSKWFSGFNGTIINILPTVAQQMTP